MARRNISFTLEAWGDYQFWIGHDKKMLKKINTLLADTLRNPFSGIGKPEPLKENYSGLWSRRIDKEHRLVYAVSDETIHVVICRFHY